MISRYENVSPQHYTVMLTISQALFQSLIGAPPLITDLPEATVFCHHSLVPPHDSPSLNFQQKLGYIYEDALAVVLDATPAYNLLSRGIQIRKKAGHTLGELDFLIKDLALDSLIHLELAVKFYLAVEIGNGFLLPGPDARDNYFRNLEKMRCHQLLLVEKYRNLLPKEFREKKIVAQQLMHGCIFDHVDASRPVESEFLDPNGRRGKWLHVGDSIEYFGRNTRLEIIPKSLWPVPLELIEGVELENWEANPAMDRCVMVRADAGMTPYFVAPYGFPG